MCERIKTVRWPVVAFIATVTLALAAGDARSQNPRARRGVTDTQTGIVLKGQTVQILDGEGNFFTTTKAQVIETRTKIGIIVWTASVSGVPNPTGRVVHWNAAKTGIPCLITHGTQDPRLCDWRVSISPNGHAILTGYIDPEVDLNRPRRFRNLP